MAAGLPHQDQRIAVLLQREVDRIASLRDQAHSADHRRWQDRAAVGLVVQRHIARHHRVVESEASLPHALDRADQFAHDFGSLGVAEIQIVGKRQRVGADRGEVAPALGNGLCPAAYRVGPAVPWRAIG